MSLLDDASLVVVPSGYKAGTVYSVKPTNGDGDLSFTRSNDTATRVNSAGLIEKAKVNSLINSVWAGVGSYIAPTNYSIINFASGTFDAGSQANSIRFTSPTTADRIMITQAPSITGVIVGSVYVEEIHSGSLDVANIIARTSGSSSVIAYLENGVVVDAFHPVSAGNTYAIVVNVTSAVTFRFGCGTSGPVAADVTLSKPQVEYGLVNTDYIETTTTTEQAGILEDMPRLDYSGGASCPSLLLEPQRTNAFTSSEYFDNWILQTNVNLTHNAIESPEGLINGVKYNISSNSQRAIDQNVTLSNGNTYTFSLYVKAIVDTTIIVRDNIGGWSENIDVLAADGWQRITSTKTITSSSTQLGFFDNSGDSGDRFYFYGAMLEEGSYPTSYIPTYGAASTRGQDACSKTGISSLIGQTEGTLFAQVGNFPKEFNGRVLAITENSNNYISIFKNGTNDDFRVLAAVGGSGVVDYQGTSTLPSNTKIAVGYANNDYVIYINGTQVHTDTSGSVPTCSNIFIGKRENGSTTYSAGGDLKQVLLFPTRLSNTQLAELTTL